MSEKYGCSKTHIQQRLQSKEQITQKQYQNESKGSKRGCAHHFQEINELTFFCFKNMHSRRLPTGNLQEKMLFENEQKQWEMNSLKHVKTLNKVCIHNNIVFLAIWENTHEQDVNKWLLQLPDIVLLKCTI